jgi:hypothetical protein
MQGRKPKFSNSLILDNIYIDEVHKQKKESRDSPVILFLFSKVVFQLPPSLGGAGGGFISHSRSYKAHYSLLFHAVCLACCSW